MSFHNRLKELRRQRNLTQSELSKATKLSQSAIAMYESGKREPKIEVLELLADYFNVDMNYITGKSDKTTLITHSVHAGYKIPVLGRVAAGVPIEAVEEILGYEYLDDKYKNDGCSYFALRIAGRSMEPTIMDGDTVIVRQQSYIESGQIAIVLVDSEDATAKQVKESPDGITLIGHNAAVYTPQFYSAQEIEDLPVKIIGRVIEVRREL